MCATVTSYRLPRAFLSSIVGEKGVEPLSQLLKVARSAIELHAR